MKYRRHNYSTMLMPNRTSYSGRDYGSAAVRDGSNNTTMNHSTMYANSNNYFFKKTRILTDMMGDKTQAQSFTMVIIIASIFFFCTVALTAALIVFCKKRNSVFVLQKSDQDTDPDYEMDEYNTDMEFTETDSDTDYNESFHVLSPRATNSPARQPLVSPSMQSSGRLVCSHSTQTGDTRGKYQQITSPSDAGIQNEDNDDSDNDDIPLRSTYSNKKYYAFATVSSDVNSDQDSSTQEQPMKMFPGDPSNNNSLDEVVNTQQVQVAAETHTHPSGENNKHTCTVNVNVPVKKGNDTPNRLYSTVNLTVKDENTDKQTELLATSQGMPKTTDSYSWGDTTPLIHASCDNSNLSQLSPFADILSSPLTSPMPELNMSPLTTKSPTEVRQSTSSKSQFGLFAGDDTIVNPRVLDDHRQCIRDAPSCPTAIHKSETTSSIFTTKQQQYERTNQAFVGSSETMLHESTDATNTSTGMYEVPVQIPGIHNHQQLARSVTSPLLSTKSSLC